jgi:hypothetical protein
MKVLIQEIRKSRLKPEELWFIDFIKDLEEVKSEDYPDSIFFKKDGEVVFEHDLKDNTLWCHYYKIWSVFEDEFGINYVESQLLIKNVVEEHLNWRGLTPTFISLTCFIRWKNI